MDLMPMLIEVDGVKELHWLGINAGILECELDAEMVPLAVSGAGLTLSSTVAFDDLHWQPTINEISWELAEDYPEARAEAQAELARSMAEFLAELELWEFEWLDEEETVSAGPPRRRARKEEE